MNQLIIEILIILLLLMGNGVFAMTELAVVSARKGRLKLWAEQGDKGAQAALELAVSPNRFLSTVQVGITLVGVLAGAFGGATVAEVIERSLKSVTALAPYSAVIGVGVVVIGITYLSLIIGELVPKRLALSNPEAIARFMAKPMMRLSSMAYPVVQVLGYSTDMVLRIFGLKAERKAKVSEDEVRLLMQEGVEAGVFHKAEPKMVESVLAMDRLPVREIMTPRAKIIFVNKDDSHEAIWHKIVVSGHSNFPVYQANRDNVVGILSVKAIYANLAAKTGVRVSDLMVPPLIVPETQKVMQLLDAFKRTGKHVALVATEFGAISGMVTLVDLLEAITGEIPSHEERLAPKAKKRDDGSWLIDGMMPIERVEETLQGMRFPHGASSEYETLAGFIISYLGHLPSEGEAFEWLNHRFEVIDMDKVRVDKVLIIPPLAKPPQETPPV